VSVILDEAERLLEKHHPHVFDQPLSFGFPECIGYVRAVEDEEAWKGRYGSLDEFYAAHARKHPRIRVYAAAQREIATADPLTSAGERPTHRLERLWQARSS
jgi:hypothetical protein